ncbi:MAG TPA: hypothetical protein ENI85_04310 [Deltaproteobacteria bacterium]|nr:hypothetical protein [Deltaproteobacteria bacterium]
MTRTNDIDHGQRDDRMGRLAPRPRCSHRGLEPRPARREGAAHTPRLFAIAALSLFALAIAPPAQAYLDPGTGSMILQVILGGVAGLVVAGKLYWKRVKEFFGRPGTKATPSAPGEGANDTTAD